ncbi:MAG: DUF4149 domain-containing protein [Gammaproteobacteria bacterium]|nr:DUF4149 domain-containing protein [Gammaproteobacteria bacterium]
MVSVSERILLTLWVGGLWAIGYLAVPVLFHALDDRQLAGELAGRMFTILSIVGLVCGALLLIGALYRAGKRWQRAWRVWALLAMVVLVAVGFFVLQPMMQDLKAQGLVEGGAQAAKFGRLHGISAIMYLATSLLGLALVIAGPGKEQRGGRYGMYDLR